MTKNEERLRAKTFQLIGEFIFWFSQLEFSIRTRLSGLLTMDDSLFDIVIGPYDFAILCTITQKVLVNRYPADEKAIVLFKRCHALNTEARRSRNMGGRSRRLGKPPCLTPAIKPEMVLR